MIRLRRRSLSRQSESGSYIGDGRLQFPDGQLAVAIEIELFKLVLDETVEGLFVLHQLLYLSPIHHHLFVVAPLVAVAGAFQTQTFHFYLSLCTFPLYLSVSISILVKESETKQERVARDRSLRLFPFSSFGC